MHFVTFLRAAAASPQQFDPRRCQRDVVARGLRERLGKAQEIEELQSQLVRDR